MNLDKEMELWETRSKDEFGTILSSLNKLTEDYFPVYTDDFGISHTLISDYVTTYSLDVNRNYVAQSIKNVLEVYDIIPQNRKIANVVRKMMSMLNK